MEEDVRLRIDAIIDEIKALLARKDEAALIAFVEDQHPADLAEAFSSLTEEERKTLFDLLPSELAADIVEELETEYQTEINEQAGGRAGLRHHHGHGIGRCHRPAVGA